MPAADRNEGVAGLLERLSGLAGGIPLYLVGGTMRDLLTGTPTRDLDLIVDGSVDGFGRRAADRLHGSFFYLRQADETARIVLPSDGVPAGAIRQIDLVPLHGGSLDRDLARRDFTVNAIAAPIDSFALGLDPETVRSVALDPMGGLRDLAAGRIRRCSPASLSDDPLRVLRGVRLAAAHGWTIEPETRAQMAGLGSALDRVSAERVRDELFLMLDAGSPKAILASLDLLIELDLLAAALRRPGAADGRRRVAELEKILTDAPWSDEAMAVPLRSYLAGTLTPPRTRAAILRLAALLADAAGGSSAPGAKLALGVKLALGSAETSFLARARRGAAAMRAGPPDDAVSAHRFYLATGDATPAALLLAVAASRGASASSPDPAPPHGRGGAEVERASGDPPWEALAAAWARAWFVERDRYLPPPLLNGAELCRRLGRRPGPWIAALLAALREAQVAGVVETAAEAWEFARNQADSRPAGGSEPPSP